MECEDGTLANVTGLEGQGSQGVGLVRAGGPLLAREPLRDVGLHRGSYSTVDTISTAIPKSPNKIIVD